MDFQGFGGLPSGSEVFNSHVYLKYMQRLLSARPIDDNMWNNVD